MQNFTKCFGSENLASGTTDILSSFWCYFSGVYKLCRQMDHQASELGSPNPESEAQKGNVDLILGLATTNKKEIRSTQNYSDYSHIRPLEKECSGHRNFKKWFTGIFVKIKLGSRATSAVPVLPGTSSCIHAELKFTPGFQQQGNALAGCPEGWVVFPKGRWYLEDTWQALKIHQLPNMLNIPSHNLKVPMGDVKKQIN